MNWSWLREREKYSTKYLIAKSKLTALKEIAVLFVSTVEKRDSLSRVYIERCQTQDEVKRAQQKK